MLRDAALNEIRVVFIPKWFVQDDINRDLLKCLSFESYETPVYTVFANNRQLAPKVRVFVDFLVERLTLF